MVLGDLFFPLRTLYYKCFYLVAFLATSRLFQCSCLENPRDGGAWWAAVYGVAQGRTRQATWQQQQQAVPRKTR